MHNAQQKWDVFISHASEDKNSFVRPLAVALQGLGLSVWYDEFSLRIGDSLSRSIDKGIAGSRYGLVVISPDFIAKAWTEYELRGLVSREIGEDKIILPIWHGVSRSQVLEFSPSLADKIALRTHELSATDMALQILRDVRPDLYSKTPRAQLERIATGEAIKDLQEQIEIAYEELNAAREELAEFKCPYCGAPLVGRNDAPLDAEEKHWDTVESFACGYTIFGGSIQDPCPADPQFPTFDDYRLKFEESSKEQNPYYRWSCYAIGQTEMAQRVHLGVGYGSTKEDAQERVRKIYDQRAARH
jgi:TIR domain